MSPPSIRGLLRPAHRWLGLAFAPLFLAVILSGALLSLQPIVAAGSSPSRAILDLPAVVAALDRVDPRGQAGALSVLADGRVLLHGRGAGPAGVLDPVTATLDPAVPFDLFDGVKRFHKSLLVNAGLAVDITAYAMTAMILAGPLLARLRWRRSAMGWHVGMGWVVLPLVLMPPLTGVLMALHVGQDRPVIVASDRPLGLARALDSAGREHDLSHLAAARQFRGGSVVLRIRGEGRDETLLLVDAGGVTALGGPPLVHRIHEGTWAGPWSGGLTLIAALVLSGLLATGLITWCRRRARSREGIGVQ